MVYDKQRRLAPRTVQSLMVCKHISIARTLLIVAVLLLSGTSHAAEGKLKLTVALAMIIVVLLVRPSGLFGRAHVRRV